MIQFYGYKKCATCRKAEKHLEQAELPYQFIDITAHPPSVDTLATIARLAGIELKKLFNTSGIQYRELKIKERLATLSNKEMLTLLAGNGRLIKRPLLVDAKRATVGYNEAIFTKIWG